MPKQIEMPFFADERINLSNVGSFYPRDLIADQHVWLSSTTPTPTPTLRGVRFPVPRTKQRFPQGSNDGVGTTRSAAAQMFISYWSPGFLCGGSDSAASQTVS